MKRTQLTLRIFLMAILLSALSGCGSTRTQNGVIIEKSASNPLKFW
jgi:uncharacterized protein YceK